MKVEISLFEVGSSGRPLQVFEYPIDDCPVLGMLNRSVNLMIEEAIDRLWYVGREYHDDVPTHASLVECGMRNADFTIQFRTNSGVSVRHYRWTY